MKNQIFLLALFLNAAEAIKNLAVTRTVDLVEAGSNLVIFNTDIEFENPDKDSFYYYTIAKDFEESFVALQVLGPHPNGDVNTPFAINFEQV